MTRKTIAILWTLLLFVVATPAAAQDVKIIVNSANSTVDLPGDVVTKLFLKQNPAIAAAIEDKLRAANGLDFNITGPESEDVVDM